MGFNQAGAPIYDFKPGDYDDIKFPGIGKPISTWGQIADAIYDVDRDSMYLMGPTVNRTGPYQDVFSYLARYDNWSSGNRKARWLIDLPDPDTDYNFPSDWHQPGGLGFQWMGLDVAADKEFICGLWGNIDVFNTTDGTLDRIIAPGPEIGGFFAWEDASMGLTAVKRKNGEFVVFTENSGYDGKCNVYRIPPSTANIAPRVEITGPTTARIGASGSVALTAYAVDDDGSVAAVDFYGDGQHIGRVTSKPYSVRWSGVRPGKYKVTAKATDNLGATTVSTPVTVNVLP
jgi:hypothetical protein